MNSAKKTKEVSIVKIKFENMSIEKFSFNLNSDFDFLGAKEQRNECLSKIKNLENSLSLKDEEIRRYICENKNSIESIANMKKEIYMLSKTNQTLLDNLEIAKSSYMNEVENLSLKIKDLDNKILEEINKNEILNNKLNEALNSITTKESANIELLKKLEEHSYQTKIFEDNFKSKLKDKQENHLVIENLRQENSSLNAEISLLKSELITLNNKNIENKKESKDSLIKFKEIFLKNFEAFNKKISSFENSFNKKLNLYISKFQNSLRSISKLKNKITILKNNSIHLKSEIANKENNFIISKKESEKLFKEKISKLELEKSKLIFQIDNYDRYIKENKKVTKEENILREITLKIESVNYEKNQLEFFILPQMKEDINKFKLENSVLLRRIADVQEKLDQYIIENSGMRKIIEERNEEIKNLKEELMKFL